MLSRVLCWVSAKLSQNADDRAVIEYVLKVLFFQVFELALVLLIAILFGILADCLLVLISFMVSRLVIFKDNWHSKNLKICTLITVATIIGCSFIGSFANPSICLLLGFSLGFIGNIIKRLEKG